VDLTLDVQILMSASSKGLPQYTNICKALLEAMRSCGLIYLAMDRGKIIENHYASKMQAFDLGMMWVMQMGKVLRINECSRCTAPHPLLAKLSELGFPVRNEDFTKYVRTAGGSSSKILVTHDTDYRAPVRRLIKRELGIEVVTAERAIEIIKGVSTQTEAGQV
jgi:hypothetical protein